MLDAKITTMRFTSEDQALVERVRKHTGIKATSEIVRMALRALVRQQEAEAKSSGRK